jgi:F-type H+-transporting ATPase subunit epsilon
MALTVRVVAPDKTIWDAPADEVILPSTTGQMGILTGHAPMMTALDTGVMRVRADKTWVPIAVMGGFAEVEANELIILVNGAERGDNIDKEEARAAFSAAESELTKAQQTGERAATIKATQAYKRARARFQAAGGMVP